MPPNKLKKTRPTPPLETGPHVWKKLKDYFEQERDYLRSIRDEDGLEDANLEHSFTLGELGDPEMWEEMFNQAYLREPGSAQGISEAKLSYYIFKNPIRSLSEEQLWELRSIHDGLLNALKDFHEYIEACRAHFHEPVVKLELGTNHEEIDQYEDISKISPEARSLVEEIRAMIDDLEQLGEKYSE